MAQPPCLLLIQPDEQVRNGRRAEETGCGCRRSELQLELHEPETPGVDLRLLEVLELLVEVRPHMRDLAVGVVREEKREVVAVGREHRNRTVGQRFETLRRPLGLDVDGHQQLPELPAQLGYGLARGAAAPGQRLRPVGGVPHAAAHEERVQQLELELEIDLVFGHEGDGSFDEIHDRLNVST